MVWSKSWIAALALALVRESLAVPAIGRNGGTISTPVGPNDLTRVNDPNGGFRYQHTQDNAPVPGIDGNGGKTIDTKSQQFHNAVQQKFGQEPGNTGPPPRMSTSQFNQESGKLFSSSTLKGPAPPENQAYKDTRNSVSQAKGQDCQHRALGRCAEGGTTSMAEQNRNQQGQPAAPGSKPMKNDQISSFGTVGGQTKNHEPCKAGQAGMFGCSDMTKNQRMNDASHPSPGAQDAQNNKRPGQVQQRVDQLDPKNQPGGAPPAPSTKKPAGMPSYMQPTTSSNNKAEPNMKTGAPPAPKMPAAKPPPTPTHTTGSTLGKFKKIARRAPTDAERLLALLELMHR